MEQLDPESYQIREVYARYGVAMYLAQCVEREISILLATEYGPGPSKITRTQFDHLLESHFEKTLGGLIRQLKKSISIPSDFENTLHTALEKRNWLAHRYFWARAGHFMSERGRDKMLLELQEAIDYFEILNAKLTDITDSWARRCGVSSEDLEKVLKRIIANAEKET
jgi:hypothetical protein